jgi:MFS family permease
MALRAYAALDRRVWTLAAIRAVNTGGLSLVMIFMGIYLVTDRGLSTTAYGLIALAANLGQSWAQGFAGMLSDRIGRRPVMAWALAIRSGVLVALGALVMNDAPIWSFVIALLASSSLRGVFEPVAYALVADVVEPRDRVVAFGLQRMGTNFGWAIGPAAGGALVVSMSYGAVFFCAAPVLLLSAVMSFRVREPEREAAEPGRTSVIAALRQAFSSRDAAIFLGGAFLFAVCHMQLFHTLAIYGKATLGLSEAELGRGYFVNAAVVLVLQLPAVALIDRIGTRAAMIAGSLLYIAAFLIVGHAAALLGVVLAIAVLTSGEVLLSPAQQAVAAELSDPDKYGRAFGVIGTVQMLGVAVGPLLGGVAFDLLGDDPVAMWSALAALPVLMLVAFVWFARRVRVLN